MSRFFTTLKERNAILYVAGWVCIGCTLLCGLLVLVSRTQVLGINAFIKPAKFFASIAIFLWTMGWFTGLLTQRRAVTIYSWVVVLVMAFEMAVIVGQASRGQLSHFNVHSLASGILFTLMGIAITTATLWTAYIGYLFVVKPPIGLPTAYLWGIRSGILIFVIFAFEGFMMAGRLAHTVGALDGGPGLPVVNWSTQYGDLRIAHFFGMHALQLIPLFGYYFARRPFQVVLFTILYGGGVTFLLLNALAGRPLLAGLGN